MRIKAGASPLQWLNGLTKRLLMLEDIVLTADGGFRGPTDRAPIFPCRGVDLRWRWDAEGGRIVIDFDADGRRLPWRWDELRPLEPRFPSTVPDLVGVGHVGRFTFEYELRSAAAESFAERSQAEDLAQEGDLPGGLAREPRGCFTFDVGLGAPGDLARLLPGGGRDLRVFFMCPGLEEPAPLELPGSDAAVEGAPAQGAAAGDVAAQVAEQVGCIMRRVYLPSNVPCYSLDCVASRALASASESVGAAFAHSQGLPLRVLQPVRVIMCLGRALEFRLLTFGYVAEAPSQAQVGAKGIEATAFMVRFLSPELSAIADGLSTFRYAARTTSGPTSAEDQLQREAPLMRSAIESAEWSPFF